MTVCLIFLLSIILHMIGSSKLKERMFIEWQPHEFTFCQRYLTSEGQVGCASSREGNVGQLQMLSSEIDWEGLNRLLKESRRQELKLILCTSLSNFIRLLQSNATDLLLNERETVAGLLLTHRAVDHVDSVRGFSEESDCPGEKFSFYSRNQCAVNVWNPAGSSMFLKDWPYPIMLLQQSVSGGPDPVERRLAELHSCFQNHNPDLLEPLPQAPRDHRRCSVELRAYPDAVGSAAICLRRREALRRNFMLLEVPLLCSSVTGGPSLFFFSGRRAPLTSNERRVRLVLLRTDARSLFNGGSVGARSVLPGLVTLLSVSRFLTEKGGEAWNGSEQRDRGRVVVFGLLAGEAFDYLGSARLAHLLTIGSFLPRSTLQGSKGLNPEDIEAVLEIGQIGADSLNKLFVHSANMASSSLISELKESFHNSSISLDVESYAEVDLPPSSSQAFLRRGMKPSIAVLTDNAAHFTAPFMHSTLDRNSSSAVKMRLHVVANNLAKLLFKFVSGGKLTEELTEDYFYAPQRFYDCFQHNYSCDLISHILPGYNLSELAGPPIPTTRFVLSNKFNYGLPIVVYELLARLLAFPVENVTSEQLCNQMDSDPRNADLSFVFAEDAMGRAGPACWRAPLKSDYQDNPVFYRSDLQDPWKTEDAVWMLSVASLEPRVRLLLSAGRAYEAAFLALGVLLIILTVALLWLLDRFESRLFVGIAVEESQSSFIDFAASFRAEQT